MKRVLLMRHAKSSWKDNSLADHDRPLNKRGKTAAPIMGKVLVENNLIPDAVICSTARRAADTLKHLQTTCPIDGSISFTREMYFADISTYIQLLSRLNSDVETAMLVGHNPDMSHALSVFANAHEHMVTAAAAAIEFKIDSWAEMLEEPQGKLTGFWKPRDFD